MRLAINKVSWTLGIGSMVLVSVLGTAAAASADEIGSQCVAVLKDGAAASAVSRVPQVGHDARTKATFYFTLARDGGIRLTLQAGEIEAEKTVYPDGRFRLQVKAGEDRVAMAAAPGEVQVERRGRQARINLDTATDDDWLQVRVLLAGSKAVRLFRLLASNLDLATLEGPAGPSILLSDAVVGFLDGDVGAIARLAGQMRAAHGARIRTVSVRGEDYLKCFRDYEAAVNQAQLEFNACSIRYPYFDPRQYGCLLVWTLQVESAWFQFLACSAIPMKMDG